MKNIFSFLTFIFISTSAMAAYTPLAAPVGSIQTNGGNGAFVGLNNTSASQTALSGLIGQPSYYVQNYGAKCNGKTLTDVTTTSGSATISSASYTFLSTDVGKQIAVSAACSAGSAPCSNLQSLTISSVSGGNATLSSNVTTSFSGNAQISFGTDDAAAINSAVTAANTNLGGVVRFPEAQCVIASPVIIKNKVSLVGQSYSRSSLKWISTHDMGTGYEGAITGLSASSGAPYSDNTIAELEVDMADATFAAGYQYYEKCIDITYMQRPNFYHLYMHDSIATCLGIDYISVAQIKDNIIVNAGRGQTLTSQDGDGMAFELSAGFSGLYESNIVTGNTIINPHHYGIEGESFTGQSNIFSIMSNNLIMTNQTNSIGIEDQGYQGAVITGNRVYSSAGSPIGFGIEVGGGPGGAGQPGIQGLISNNVVTGFLNGIQVTSTTGGTPSSYAVKNNTVLSSQQYGIDIVGSGTNVLDGIQVQNNYVKSALSCGICVLSTGGTPSATNLTITDNILAGNGGSAGSDALKSGIYIGMTTTGLNAQGNYAYDGGASAQKYGFTLNTGITASNAFLANNHLNNNTTSATNILGTFTGIQFENYGDATSYPLTNSAVATFTNKTYDTAGTGNVFKINGMTISSISGNTSEAATASGTLTNGHCVSIDGSGNFVDAGGACTTGGGGGTVSSGTANQFTYYAGTGTTVSGNSSFTTATVPRLNAAGTWTAGQAVTPSTVSISTSTYTPDFSVSNNFNITLVHASCPCTLANPANIVAGQTGVIVANQSATGSDLIGTYGSDWKFAGATAPTLSTGASATDVLSYYVIDSTHILLVTGALNAH